MKLWRYHLQLLSLMVYFSCQINGVVAQETVKEFWPEIDAWLRLSPKWRFSIFIPISKNIETKYREGNLIAQVDYAFGNSHFFAHGTII